MALEFSGPALKLTNQDIVDAANSMRWQTSVVLAVRDVESGGSGFLPDGRPKGLFEAHAFYTATGGIYGSSNISSPTWNKSLYGAGGAHQYDRLAEAIKKNRLAAIKSFSWGMFQIMGSNFVSCGFTDAESFVDAMVNGGERAHLNAFVKFVASNRLDDELRSNPPQFAAFARGYNGPGYAANAYDVKLAAAWRKWSATGPANSNTAPRAQPQLFYTTLQINSSGPKVFALQSRLVMLGYELATDSDFGPETQADVVSFQRKMKLIPDGIVGPATAKALGIDLAA